MTEKELVKVLQFISDSYPNFDYPLDSVKASKRLQAAWYEFLKAYPYQLVNTATKALVVSYPDYAPSVGKLVQEIKKILEPEENKISGQEAWGQVIELISRYGVQYGYKKIMDRLSDKQKQAVRAVGGLELIGRNSADDTYLMNQFAKAYEAIREREKDMEKIPQHIRKDIERISRPEVEKLTGKVKNNA